MTTPGIGDRVGPALYGRPRIVVDPALHFQNGQGGIDVEGRSVHPPPLEVLLGAKHVVHLLADRGEVALDLAHLMLQRELRHDPAAEERRAGPPRSGRGSVVIWSHDWIEPRFPTIAC